MADESDDERQAAKDWVDSVARSKAFAPISAEKLLSGIRQQQKAQERQATTGRIQDTSRPPPDSRQPLRKERKKSEKLVDQFRGAGSTASRKKFWDKVADAVSASRKAEGRNASVQEHQGIGTVINFPDQKTSACADTATITLTGVTLDCGCVLTGIAGPDVSSVITDDGGVNDNPQTLNLVTCGSPSDANCLWFNLDADGVYFFADEYASSDCSGSPSSSDDHFCNMYIVKIGSVYQVLVTQLNTIIFYGSGSDLASISNASTVCDPTRVDYDSSDPIIGTLLQCAFGGSATFSRAGYDGAATITIP